MTEGSAVLRHAFPTRGTPYTVTFSGSGRWLVYGEGGWYGGGRLGAIRTGSETIIYTSGESFLIGPDDQPLLATVSGICFNADDGFLAVSAWSWKQEYCPSFLLETRDDGSFRLARRFPVERNRAPDVGASTGVLGVPGGLWIRRAANDPHDVLRFEPCDEFRESVAGSHHHSARLARVENRILTGARVAHLIERYGEETRLIRLEADTEGFDDEPPDPRRVDAVTVSPTSRTVITGTARGRLWRWRRTAGGLVADSSVAGSRGDDRSPGPLFLGTSVTAACCLPGDERFLTANAGGHVAIHGWESSEGGPVSSWSIPDGSPRSAAIHPDGGLVAVGAKNTRPTEPGGWIYVYEIG